MEIDKKIILKLIESLEQLKKSVKNLGEEISKNDIDKEEELIDQNVITSPIVGTLILHQNLSKKICRNWKKIKKGDTIMIVEAMKQLIMFLLHLMA